jgi:molecular chaperone GrpE
LADLEKRVSKLGREQYKANTLAEAQAERLAATLEALQAALERQEAAREEAVRKARLDILEALLPVLDSLEAGLKSGGRHAYRLHRQGSPEGATLMAWLDGQRLLRDRLLALLEAEGIQPIPTAGQPFDPYRHVAAGMVKDESLPEGQIVAEELRGYATGDRVLRYAQVVVVRNQ